MHIRQPPVDAVVADGELRMINAQQMHHRGMDVIACSRVRAIQRLVPPLVTLAGSDATLDPAAAAARPADAKERAMMESRVFID